MANLTIAPGTCAPVPGSDIKEEAWQRLMDLYGRHNCHLAVLQKKVDLGDVPRIASCLGSILALERIK